MEKETTTSFCRFEDISLGLFTRSVVNLSDWLHRPKICYILELVTTKVYEVPRGKQGPQTSKGKDVIKDVYQVDIVFDEDSCEKESL